MPKQKQRYAQGEHVRVEPNTREQMRLDDRVWVVLNVRRDQDGWAHTLIAPLADGLADRRGPVVYGLDLLPA